MGVVAGFVAEGMIMVAAGINGVNVGVSVIVGVSEGVNVEVMVYVTVGVKVTVGVMVKVDVGVGIADAKGSAKPVNLGFCGISASQQNGLPHRRQLPS